MHALPILVLNLGGEMFYILSQRLKAQNIQSVRAVRILNDVAATLLNDVFIHEIFKPQPLYNKQKLYLLFREIAHSSVMKLNETSMGKLYDLMSMVFKYQLYYARPNEIILITLNHLNSLRNLVSSPNVHKQLDSVYYLLTKVYLPFSDAQLQRMRYDLLNYFQDIRIKVSIFLRLGLQNNDGTFIKSSSETVPFGCQIPGRMKLFNGSESLEDVINFPSGGEYTIREKHNFESKINKGITLGTSIYEEKTFIQELSWFGNENIESRVVKTSAGQDYRSEMSTLMQQLLGSKQWVETEAVLLDVFIDELSSPNDTHDWKEVEEIETVTISDKSAKRIVCLDTVSKEVAIELPTCPDHTDDLLYLLENTN